jgi:hypothetical protein
LAKHCQNPYHDVPNVSALAAQLTSTAKSDEQRAWAVFAWICHNIHYDIEAHFSGKQEIQKDASEMFATRTLQCGGFANLYAALGEMAGLSTQTVIGYCRRPVDTDEAIGKDVLGDSACRHAWNLVLLDGEWSAVDCTWGAGGFTEHGRFERRFRPLYFGMPAEQLAFTHYPLDQEKQTLSYQRFIAQPTMFAEFFEHGLRFCPEAHPAGIITLKDSNTASLRLVVPTDRELLVDMAGRKEACLQELLADGTTQITLNVPRGAARHKMKISVRNDSYAEGHYALACIFAVNGPGSPTTLVESFPLVYHSVFRSHGLKFAESLPIGRFVLTEQNDVQIRLCAPDNVQAVAQVGDGTVFTQRSGGEISVLAQCPLGDHELDIFVRRQEGDDWTDLQHAVTYYVNVKPGCRHVNTAGFPETFDIFQELDAFLEAPLSGVLKSGKTHFRFRVDPKRVARVLVLSGGSQKALVLTDGVFQCDFDVVAPSVQLACSTPSDPGDFDAALAWTVE